MNGFWKKRGDALALDWVQPEMKDALAWLRKLWAEGVFTPDSITVPLGDAGNAWQGGITGNAYSAWTSMDFTQAKIREVQPDALLVAGPAITGPNGDNGFTGEGWPWVYVMPKTAKNPDRVMQVLDWFYTPDVAAQIICEGVLNVTNKGLNDKGWCEEFTPAEKEAMGADWAAKQDSVKDIEQYAGLWLPFLYVGQTPIFSTMPDDMKKHFEDIVAAKYSPASLEARDISQKYIRLTEKKRPVDAEKESWPGLQTRFAEFISQAVTGTIDLESGWTEWLAYFEANGGPTITEQVNQI
jgi:ABC-type glycerol-3-phosphate transport system substrate-binding protein